MFNCKDDFELFSLMREKLFTAVVGDVLDAMGYRKQFLPPEIKSLRSDMVIAGKAMPVLEADCFSAHVSHTAMDEDFGLMFRALDDLTENEVYICTGASRHYALWGELMSICAARLGCTGAIVDGYSRDTQGILNMNFPVFSRGTYGQDQRVRGRVIDFRCKLEFDNGTEVNTGDIVFGDIDGVLIIPSALKKEVIAAALNKVDGENTVKNAIENGMSATQAWEKYGIM